MLRVNKLTDYATVVLIDIAGGRALQSTHQISDHTGIPFPTVAKLMKSLSRAGLVRALRGTHGGYAMARDMHAITIADIIQAVEGPIALTACADTSDEHCGIEKICPVQGKWNRVNRAVTEALRDVTLADMVADVSSFGIGDRVAPERVALPVS